MGLGFGRFRLSHQITMIQLCQKVWGFSKLPDDTINQASLKQDVSNRIEIIGVIPDSVEWLSVTHEVS